MINVRWSNRLETLAAAMFREMDAERADRPDEVLGLRPCVIVPNRIVQHWLQHEFLFRDAPRRVLANWDFPLLNVFINDRLFRLTNAGDTRRDPESHPFSREALAWRIHDILGSALLQDARFAALRRYLAPGHAQAAEAPSRLVRRRFKLARKLATLFDEYTVYRPEMLLRWERNDAPGLPASLAWQPALWQALTAGGLSDQTYLAAFRRMRSADLADCGIADYRRIRVFGVSMLPRVYIHFFERLSQSVRIDFFALNPSDQDWFSRPPEERESPLEGRLEHAEELFDPGHAFLGAQGRGNRSFLIELLDRTEGQAEAEGEFTPPGGGTLLRIFQSGILANDAGAGGPLEGERNLPPARQSVQVHVCHGPMREVEVLRDHLLRWFTEEPDLQPRQVQVQVSDMAAYAPYIHAVFAAENGNAPETIPYAIADRVVSSESAVAAAFTQLLDLADSRFAASEILDLLQCEPVREAFGIAEAEIETIREWVAAAGIRWGRTSEHRKAAVGVGFEDFTTWRRGMDRLLLGFACGREGCDVSGEHVPLPCDCVEGDGAVTLGRFAAFVGRLETLADAFAGSHKLADWADKLDEAITTFFAATNTTYQEIGLLRQAVAMLRKSAAAAQFNDPVDIAVARDFLAARLRDVVGGDDLGANVVVFSALRPGSSVPRRVVCLLGMAGGLFPRSDSRAAYDLLRLEHRSGDRSPRQEDRMAFLEAVLSARDRFYISYTGFTAEENQRIPPSVVVAEFQAALDQATGRPGAGQVRQCACRPVEHRLQPYHRAHFEAAEGTRSEARHFSYAASACNTARALQERQTGPAAADAPPAVQAAAEAGTIELDQLIRFFRSPAEAYYRDVLGVRLDAEREAALADQESFLPKGLEENAINMVILDTQLSADPAAGRDAARRRLLEQGLLPLGRRGCEWFDTQWREIQAFLEKDNESLGRQPVAALREQRAATPERCTVRLECGMAVTGRVVRIGTAEGAWTIDARYVKDKALDRLACWLRHLFACAAARAGRRVYLQRNHVNGDEAAALVYDPLEAGAAAGVLGKYVALYREGQGSVLPFTLLVSTAFAKQFNAGKTEDVALAASRKEWERATAFFGPPPERDNPYNWAAFGSRGPYGDRARFCATARIVFPKEPSLIP